MEKKREIKGRGFRISYHQIILDILKLTDDGFAFDMECIYSLPTNDPTKKNREFTQEEAREMARRLGNIYGIAHCEYCSACAGKYRAENIENRKLLSNIKEK